MLVLIILSSIFIIAASYFWRWAKLAHNNYKVMIKIPGPPGTGFLLGNALYLRASPEEIFRRFRDCARNFYPIYKLYAVHKVVANILSPEDCELILANPVHNEKSHLYKSLHNWLRSGLLTSKGTKWQTRRRILTPAFHFSILQQFVHVFNEGGEKLVELLKMEPKNSDVNIRPLVTQFTLRAIAETAMGVKLKFESPKEKYYKKAIYEIGEIVMYRTLHPWCIDDVLNLLSPHYLREIRVINTLRKFTREVIDERQKNFKVFELPEEEHDVYKGKRRLAMLDLLILAKQQEGIINNEGIQEEVDTFMFEGHDTTSTVLCFTLMLIACHADVQDRIVQEMKDVLDDIHKKPTYNDLQNFKYLERCIKESLRLYPSAYFIARTLGEDLQTSSGYFLPKGGDAVIHIYDIHHNPDIYPDPEKFDPDRFLPENVVKRHPFAYLPFSAGPRNCIGQRFAMLELKAAICAILANFILEPVDTPETIVLVVDLVLRTKDGIRIRFVPRPN